MGLPGSAVEDQDHRVFPILSPDLDVLLRSAQGAVSRLHRPRAGMRPAPSGRRTASSCLPLQRGQQAVHELPLQPEDGEHIVDGQPGQKGHLPPCLPVLPLPLLQGPVLLLQPRPLLLQGPPGPLPGELVQQGQAAVQVRGVPNVRGAQGLLDQGRQIGPALSVIW